MWDVPVLVEFRVHSIDCGHQCFRKITVLPTACTVLPGYAPSHPGDALHHRTQLFKRHTQDIKVFFPSSITKLFQDYSLAPVSYCVWPASKTAMWSLAALMVARFSRVAAKTMIFFNDLKKIIMQRLEKTCSSAEEHKLRRGICLYRELYIAVIWMHTAACILE